MLARNANNRPSTTESTGTRNAYTLINELSYYGMDAKVVVGTDRIAESDMCPAPGYIHDANKVRIKGRQRNQGENGGQDLYISNKKDERNGCVGT